MPTLQDFSSDNHSAAHPAVLEAIAEANIGPAPSYGADQWTLRAEAQLRSLFGPDAGVYFVFNGTAANVLGVSLLLRHRYEAVICADTAHLNSDECGAAEQLLGCKLLTVSAPDGKLTPDLVAQRLAGRQDEHRVVPRVVAISQATELGTCYTLEELGKLSDFCRSNGLPVYIDGARLANAAAHLGCGLSEFAAHADVLSFGGTKNGAIAAEAVIVMRPELCADASYQRKQLLQLASKMRFLAAQFIAMTADGLWLRSARRANAMATRLADAIRGIPGVEILQPVEANGIFARLQPDHIKQLQQEWDFYPLDSPADMVRWMTSFDTTESDVDTFASAIRAVCGRPPRL